MRRTEINLLASLRSGSANGPGCHCCVCGASPFDSAGPRARVLGDNFTDYDLLVQGAEVCQGCASLLAGRPGDNPPPLRTVNVAAGEGWIEYPDRAGIHARMRDPTGLRVLSFATSRKKHHWIRAGLCTPERLLIGCDDGTTEYRPDRDAPLLAAVSDLLASPTGTGSILSREAIRTGEYHPEAVRKFGLARWRDLEATVKRWRPSLLLDLVAVVTPLSGPVPGDKEVPMHDPTEVRAATLLARLATASLVRRKDGKVFWGGFLRHRVERFRCLSLNEMASRLMDVLAVSPTDPAAMLALHDLGAWTPTESAAVAKAIETKSALIVAMAFEQCRAKGEVPTAPVATPATKSAPLAAEGGLL